MCIQKELPTSLIQLKQDLWLLLSYCLWHASLCGSPGKEFACNGGDLVWSLGWEDPWGRERLPIPVFRPGEFHELHSPWGCKESDTTELLSLHFISDIESFICSFIHLFIHSSLIHSINTCFYPGHTLRWKRPSPSPPEVSVPSVHRSCCFFNEETLIN